MVADITNHPRIPYNIRCQWCNLLYTIYADPHDVFDWQNKKGFIQDILHYLTDGERELFIARTCGPCFDKLYPYNGIDNEEDVE